MLERNVYTRLRLDKRKNNSSDNKSGEELDQAEGNWEDDIGDVIANVREQELLYGTDSFLAIFN